MKPRSWFAISSLALLTMPIQAVVARPDPCSLLEQSEVEALLGGRVSAQQKGPSCMWLSGKQQLILLNVGVATPTSSGGNRALAQSSYPFDGYTQNYYRIGESIARSETHVYGNGHNGEAMQLPSATPLEMEMNRAYLVKQRTQLPPTNAAFPRLMTACKGDKCARATLNKENRQLVMQLRLDTKVSDEQLANLEQLAESAITRRAR